VIAFRTKRHRRTAPLAALLLVLQALAGGVVALVHASDQLNAPTHIEAQHSSSCLPLHNELRCALCHYAATRVVPQQARVQPAAATRPVRPCAPATVVRKSDAGHLTAPPRAPPPLSL
jgi:hypothetical protein